MENSAPRDEFERYLCNSWAALLGAERVDIRDNFFDLGGDSALAEKVILALRRELGIDLEIEMLREHPTIEELARVLEEKALKKLLVRKKGPPSPDRDSTEHVPFPRRRTGEAPMLSFGQQRLWFLQLLEPESVAYNVCRAYRLAGSLDANLLARSYQLVVAPQEVLRTRILSKDGCPVAVLSSEIPALRIVEVSGGEQEVQRLLSNEAGTPFRLDREPLIRGTLYITSEYEQVLTLTLHHSAVDDWSISTLLKDIFQAYSELVRIGTYELPELPIQYADYAAWQREHLSGKRLREEIDFWKRYIAPSPPTLDLPTDFARPSSRSYRGVITPPFQLPPELIRRLREFARTQRTTLFIVLMAAYELLMSRYSRQQQFTVGVPVAVRRWPVLDRLCGYFGNTLVIPCDVNQQCSFREFANHIQGRMIEALAHQDVSFDKLVEELEPERDTSRTPLFQVLFSYRQDSKIDLSIHGIESRAIPVNTGGAKFDLAFAVVDGQSEVGLSVEYSTDLFKASTIERMVGHYFALLEQLLDHPQRPLAQAPILTAGERERVLHSFNDTQMDFPRDKCIHELVEAQVEKTPKAFALVFEGVRLTYAELNQRANRLAHYLRGLGVAPDVRVAIYLERGFEMIVALLAVLKAGGAYVPLDPAYPVQRLKFMLEDSNPVVLLTEGHLAERLRQMSGALPVLDLGDPAAPWRDHPETNTEREGLTPRHLAYVIYTSGSTGTPKGVMIEHRGVCNLAFAQIETFSVSSDSRVLQFASFSFDACIWEVVMSLCGGATLYLVRDGKMLAGESLIETVKKNSITHATLPPALLTTLLDPAELHSVAILIAAGDVLPGTLARRWMRDRRLINAYGPTEATVCATLHECHPNEVGNPSIGRPIANMRIYILDEHQQPVPVGVTGEMYIGGCGVARGYLNRSELTAERFLLDPFVSDNQASMFRTGDLGKWSEDGNIEFLGREDFQVKIRGFRIELGEIEATLARHSGVREVVVVARESGAGKKRLVAYYTAEDTNDGGPDAEDLRAYLSPKLPEYMVPAAYVRLDSVPLTSNGKVARKALPEPEADAYGVRGYEAPRGETEKTLAGIWADVLKLERVGRHDNFFKLGGHSLLAVTLIERMRRVGLHLDVQALFATPTLADVAAAVDLQTSIIEVPPNRIPSIESAPVKITPEMLPLVQLTAEEIDRIVGQVPGGAANVQDIYPLAPLQEGVLFHHLNSRGGDPYLAARHFSFDNRARLEAYLEAMRAVIGRHDILRTAVMWEGLLEPVQVVWRQAVLPVEEVVLDPAGGDAAKQLYARFSPRQCRIEVSQAPLMRIYVAYDPPYRRWLMMQLMHQLAVDHSTVEVMQEEIEAHLLGRAELLPEPLPFRNLVAQARLGVSQQEHEVFFRKLLGDVEEPTAPFGLLDVQGDGTGIEEAQMVVDASLARRIRDHARRLGVSAASVFHLAWGQVLGRVSGRQDVVFGTVLFGRMEGGTGSDKVMGLFINTLPVRIPAGEEGVEKSVRQTHAQLAELMRHEHASLALAQRCSKVSAPTPLFSALLNYRHVSNAVPATSEESKRAWEGIHYWSGEERTNYPWTLSVSDMVEGFLLTSQVVASIGPMRVCEFMHTTLESLVEALESAPDRAVRALEVMGNQERLKVLYEWNDTGMEFPRDRCIQELFEEQVDRTPEAIAVEFEDKRLTYSALNMRANRLAHHLRRIGIGPDTLVGVCMERSLEMVVALYGVLKAGGAYVPIDPEYPPERIAFMLEDACAPVLLTQRLVAERLPHHACKSISICLDTDWDQVGDENITNPLATASPSNLAYVIYTSGSTGRPKGAMITHRGIANRLLWMQVQYPLTEADTILQKTPFSFDVSVWEFFWPLLAGARLLLAKPGGHRDAAYLVNLIVREQITVAHFVPPMLQVFLEQPGVQRCLSLRYVICSGEALQFDLQERFFELLPARLHNLYGPTEAAVDVTHYSCERNGVRKIVPIGRPVANTQIYILDQQLQPVPIGVTGELHIGGVQVGRGYHNRPDLTVQRFIPDPFGGDPEARLYKTGDVCRWLPDGNIEYLGRRDHQVKIRGFRIELGEIESVVDSHPEVRQSVVVAREDRPGDKRVVAYFVPSGDRVPDDFELRSLLKQHVPDYMIPADFIALKEFPLTPNGKIDRRTLPAPELTKITAENWITPRTSIEQRIQDVWAAVLKRERIGVTENFFDLGGHSLLAMQAVIRIANAFGIDLPVAKLFENPTIEALALAINSSFEFAQSSLCEMPRARTQIPSFGQERMWVLDQIHGSSPVYNIPIVLRLKGALNTDALLLAVRAVVDRHDVLRTVYKIAEGALRLEPLDHPHVEVPLIEVAGATEAEREAQLTQWVESEARQVFRLDRDLLLRAALFRLAAKDHTLVLTMHHIAFDGWSEGILLREIEAFYNAFETGTSLALHDLPIRFSDYAQSQRARLTGEPLEKLSSYWLDHLSGASFALQLPTDRPRPAVQTFVGAFEPVILPENVICRLREFCGRANITPFMIILAGLYAILHRYSGQPDILVGSPVASRTSVETEDMIGYFTNTLVLRANFSNRPTFRELVEQVRRTVLGALEHQEMPIEKLIERINPERDLSRSALFQVMLVMQNTPTHNLNLHGLQASPSRTSAGTAPFDLTFSLTERSSDMRGGVVYNADLFDGSTIRRTWGHLCNLLEHGLAAPDTKVTDLSVLSAEEVSKLLVDWNKTEQDYPLEVSMAELFGMQVVKSPDAVAVVCGENSLTYEKLNERANQLGHELVKRGAGPGNVVGIFLDRSLDMIVAFLAVLKSGAAYLPFDPRLPQARLAWMIEDSGLGVLVTRREFMPAIPEMTVKILMDDGERWHTFSRENLQIAVKPEHLAYVIYTSGSSGRPKGVQVSRRALLNFLWSVRECLNFTSADRLLAITTISFDIAGLEIWLPLLTGAQTIVASSEDAKDGDQLKSLIERHDITFLQATPVTWWLLMDCKWRGKANLVAICGGESMSPELAERLGSQVKHLWNFYGPTETTIWSTAHEVKNESGPIPIGRPLGNTQCYILDEERQPVPIGVVGELYIAGEGLARGYLNQPELTTEKFVPNLFSAESGARMYRTGDLARYLPSGNIECLGRRDDQLKIRGFRVELGEIETVLKQHPGIQQAVVVAREDRPGEKRLVAYFVPTTNQVPEAAELRNLSKQQLPDYMIPADYIALKEIPLTPNGKIDRKALPALERARDEDGNGYVAPRDEFERYLCGAWADGLGLEKVGIHDNFFDLGGHSILAVHLWSRVAEILPGMHLPLSTLLEAPTVEQLANRLRNARSEKHEFLVRMRAGTPKRPPLFFVHGAGGNVLKLRPFAMALPADLPFYCFQDKGLSSPKPFESIEETARSYVEDIRRSQPHGPYYIGGACYGGLVAFEMACVFEQLGEPVASVILIDSRNPAFVRSLSKRARFFRHVKFVIRQTAWHASMLHSERPRRWFSYIRRRLTAMRKHVRGAYDPYTLDVGVVGTPLGETLGRVLKANFDAASKFMPKPYRGNVIIVRSSENRSVPYDDYLMGWKSVVLGTIDCFEIEANHNTIYENPAVDVIAEKLGLAWNYPGEQSGTLNVSLSEAAKKSQDIVTSNFDGNGEPKCKMI